MKPKQIGIALPKITKSQTQNPLGDSSNLTEHI